MSKTGEEMTETARLQTELDVRQQTQSAYYEILVAQDYKGEYHFRSGSINKV